MATSEQWPPAYKGYHLKGAISIFIIYATSEQWPPVNNGLNFRGPRVAVVHRFECTSVYFQSLFILFSLTFLSSLASLCIFILSVFFPTFFLSLYSQHPSDDSLTLASSVSLSLSVCLSLYKSFYNVFSFFLLLFFISLMSVSVSLSLSFIFFFLHIFSLQQYLQNNTFYRYN